MGVILGVAVLLDAMLIRLVLVPVAFRLLGKTAWALPPGSAGSSPTSGSATNPAPFAFPDLTGIPRNIFPTVLVRMWLVFSADAQDQ